MRLSLLTTALVAASLRLRRADGPRPSLVAKAHAHGRVYPRLQHTDTYESDFVHDDTEHPDEAIKINIKESENALREAKDSMTKIESKLAAAKKAHEDAAKLYDTHAAETTNAKEMIAKYNASLVGASDIKAGVEEAKVNLTAAMDKLNVTDTAATAAAEAIKAAQKAFHDANLLVVEAKENATAEAANVKLYQDKVTAAQTANVSLEEWSQKLNASTVGADELAAQVATAKKAFDETHAHYKAAEARLSEAQKLFDVDKEQYEQMVGPYVSANGEKEEDNSESSWWDVLTGEAWN